MASHYPWRHRQPATTMRKNKIKIPLPSRPTDYVPGSGPPLRRVALQPPADSTAYIEDRILLPPAGLAADGRPLPKRMKYIIGWHDLPAARLLVSAMDILDYVSPHALEEWEYNMELELDVERARLEAERQALKRQTLAHDPAAAPPPAKRKPGRPPLHTKIEAAVVAETDEKDGEQGRLRGGAMSLSTPKKRKMDDFADGYTSDESPSEQLLFDFAQSRSHTHTPHVVKEEEAEITDANDVPPASISMVPVAPMQVDDDNDRYRFVKSQYSKKPRPTEKIVLPLVSASKAKPTRSESPGLPFPLAKGRPRGLIKSSVQAKLHSSKPITEYLSSIRSTSSTPQPPSQRSSIKPSPAPQLILPSEREIKDNLPAKYKAAEAQIRDTKLETQPPKPKSALPTAKPTPASVSSDSDSESGSGSDSDESGWVVQRLEDMELYEVEGKGLVRYFKVRWEGDWPADQNPTWEPEENIPDDIVRTFCKTFKKQHKGGRVEKRVGEEEDELPTPRATQAGENGAEGDHRPSTASSGMFVYSSDDGMEKHTRDAPNAQGLRPNLNGVYPANMK